MQQVKISGSVIVHIEANLNDRSIVRSAEDSDEGRIAGVAKKNAVCIRKVFGARFSAVAELGRGE